MRLINDEVKEIKVIKSSSQYRVVETNRYGHRVGEDGKSQITIKDTLYDVSYEGSKEKGFVIKNKEVIVVPSTPSVGSKSSTLEPKGKSPEEPIKIVPPIEPEEEPIFKEITPKTPSKKAKQLRKSLPKTGLRK